MTKVYFTLESSHMAFACIFMTKFLTKVIYWNKLIQKIKFIMKIESIKITKTKKRQQVKYKNYHHIE